MRPLALLFASSVSLAACKSEKPSPAMLSQGRDLFASTCAKCHGESGSGGVPAAAGQPAPRDLRDHVFQSSRTDGQLRAVIVSGKGTAMPAFGTLFDDAQLRALVAYLRTLDPEGAR